MDRFILNTDSMTWKVYRDAWIPYIIQCNTITPSSVLKSVTQRFIRVIKITQELSKGVGVEVFTITIDEMTPFQFIKVTRK